MCKYYVTDPYTGESQVVGETPNTSEYPSEGIANSVIIDSKSNYAIVMNEAYQARFGRDAISYPQPEEVVEEEIVEEVVTVRKNKVAIFITMIAALLAIALAALSFVNIDAIASYTAYYSDSLMGLTAIFSDIAAQDILTFITVVLLLASVLLAIVTFIRCIVMLASKKKQKLACICPLLFLALIIASVVVFVIGLASFALDSIVTDIGIATIITVALAIIAFVASIFSYKK